MPARTLSWKHVVLSLGALVAVGGVAQAVSDSQSNLVVVGRPGDAGIGLPIDVRVVSGTSVAGATCTAADPCYTKAAPNYAGTPTPVSLPAASNGSSTGPFRTDPSLYVNTMACACTNATLYGDGGTLGATTNVDAGAANIPVLPYGETVLSIGSNSDVTIARDALCVIYASGGITASLPSGVYPWTVPNPNVDGGFTTTYYNVCSQSGTTRVCICPRSAVAP